MIFDQDSQISLAVQPDGNGDIRSLTIIPRDGYRLVASALSRIPVAQIRRLIRQSEHPNDQIWKHAITQRKIGQRSWPDEHWAEVISVFSWAQETHRPGGGAKAVTDLWGVSLPTARRWIKAARRKLADGALSSPSD